MSTKIRLLWKTDIDARHLQRGINVRIVRLYALVGFKTSEGWSEPIKAIVDTGSPLTLLPKFIWQEIQISEILSDPFPLGGVGKGVLMARLAKIELALLGTRKETVKLIIKAYLAEDDSAPLLFGIEDLLTNSRLVCDYPKSKAFLQVG